MLRESEATEAFEGPARLGQMFVKMVELEAFPPAEEDLGV